jgi:hypothetical protein
MAPAAASLALLLSRLCDVVVARWRRLTFVAIEAVVGLWEMGQKTHQKKELNAAKIQWNKGL